MSTKTRPTIDLDGTVYTGRKWTNGLRAQLGDEPINRAQKIAQIQRTSMRGQHILGQIAKGESSLEDAEAVADNNEQVAELERALQDSAVQLAPKLFVDAEGNAPSPKDLDEHADLDELATAVAVVLGEEDLVAPDPTPDPVGSTDQTAKS